MLPIWYSVPKPTESGELLKNIAPRTSFLARYGVAKNYPSVAQWATNHEKELDTLELMEAMK